MNAKLPRYMTALYTLALIGAILLVSGCATPQENARTMLDRMEFDENEYGTFELEGTIDLNSLPFVQANVHVKLEKIKPQLTDQVQP